MTAPIKWHAAHVEQLLIMHKSRDSVRRMATKLPYSPQAIGAKLKSMGLRYSGPMEPIEFDKRPKVVKIRECYRGTFEDHPDADSDRWLGRRPQRAATALPTATTAAEC